LRGAGVLLQAWRLPALCLRQPLLWPDTMLLREPQVRLRLRLLLRALSGLIPLHLLLCGPYALARSLSLSLFPPARVCLPRMLKTCWIIWAGTHTYTWSGCPWVRSRASSVQATRWSKATDSLHAVCCAGGMIAQELALLEHSRFISLTLAVTHAGNA
jgi:hypothetical protein